MPRKSGLIVLSYYYAIADATLGSAKVRVKVIYNDGTPPTSRTINLTGGTVTGSYAGVDAVTAVASKNVASIKIEVLFKSTTGTLLVDNLSMRYYALTGTRGVLPVPAAAH